MQLTIEHENGTAALGTLPSGDAGIAATVAAMQATIDDAVAAATTGRALRLVAQEVSAAAGTPGAVPFARELWNWLADHVHFQRDPAAVELLRAPGALLACIDQDGECEGDCDDLAMLAASILAVAGLRPVLITVGRRRTGQLEHVFAGVRLGDGPLSRRTVYPIDSQEGTPAGTWPATPRVRLWSLTVTLP
jgi:hypothetical protein